MENTVKGRRWIKSALIAFFAIILLLTFFSNTIQNRSLPEVSIYRVKEGTITAKVMGMAVVEAAQQYKIILYQTRTVKTVHIRGGDTLAEGDLLFTLSGWEGLEEDIEIRSPISGKVAYVNISPGEQTAYGKELAVIEAEGCGAVAHFQISTEMASRFTVGDKASLMGVKLSKEASAVLHAKELKPGDISQTELYFDVQNVSIGTALYITLGDRGTAYSTVVPNSAVRQDTNGLFVLVLKETRTPLGNRYTAERVNVSIIDRDDAGSALSGGIREGDTVIINSSKPLEPGIQVKLA